MASCISALVCSQIIERFITIAHCLDYPRQLSLAIPRWSEFGIYRFLLRSSLSERDWL